MSSIKRLDGVDQGSVHHPGINIMPEGSNSRLTNLFRKNDIPLTVLFVGWSLVFLVLIGWYDLYSSR